MTLKPRLAAAQSLENILMKKLFSNRVAAEWLNKTKWLPEDQGLYLRLVYGTLEHLMLIDAVIQKHSGRSPAGIDSSVRGILRVSIYQILFADRIPTYAVIHEAVEMTKGVKMKAAGFVNAVLRSMLLELTEAPDREAYLHQICRQQHWLCFSHPEWLLKRLRQDYDERDVMKILETHQKPPALTICLNGLKGTKDTLVHRMEHDGIRIQETGWLPEAYSVTGSSGLITRSASYRNGLFQIQSLVSMLAVHWLDPQPGETIIDVAAAPGGKTAFIAQRMHNQGKLLARDLSPKKLRQIEPHVRRMGCSIVSTQVHDGTLPDPQWKEKADRLLLDAPCSSMGMIRKKPELKFLKSESELHGFPGLQKRLLDMSAQLVKPGGILLYATCTYFREENHMVVETFRRRHPEFALESLVGLAESIPIPVEILEKGMVQMGPHLHEDLDGFFVAKFRRRRD